MRGFVLVAGVVGALVLALWLMTRAPDARPVDPRRAPDASLEITDSSDGSLDDERVAEAGMAPATVPERSNVRSLAGVVRDAEGRSVDGATVTWTPVREDLRDERSVRQMDWEWIRTATRTTSTGSDGEFRFDEPPGDEGDEGAESVLWASHPGHGSAFVLLSRSEQSQGEFPVIELHEHPSMPVRVLRSGAPAAGAVVRHTLDFWTRTLTDDEQLARRFFLRERVADDDGRATLVPAEGTNLLQGFLGDLRSSLWRDDPEEGSEIALELLGAFTLSGRVFVDAADHSFEGVRYHIGYYTAEDLSDFTWAFGSQRVDDRGRFGPDTWARPDHRMLRVRVSGGGLLPVSEDVLLPDSGAELYLEFETSVGFEIAVEVVDGDGVALEGATVAAYGLDDMDRLSFQAEARTDDAGRVTIRALRAGEVDLLVSLEGYQSEEVADERTVLPRLDEDPVRIELAPAGVIHGTTVHQGEPVTSFTVSAWNVDTSYLNTLHIEDDDGEFLFDDAPNGETVYLTAHAEGLPQSDVVSVPPGGVEELVLELPPPRQAVGRALDGVTLEPVPTATVQPLVSGSTEFLTWRDRPIPVEPDGVFVIEGVAAGRGGFELAAPGYESIYVTLPAADADVLEVGDFLLSAQSTLHVQVIDDRAINYTAYRAWNEYLKSTGPTAFEADGTCKVPSYSLYDLRVQTPDGTLLGESASIGPGEEPYILFDLTQGTDLFVSLKPVPDGVQDYMLEVYSSEGDSSRSRGATWDGEARGFLVSGLSEGDALLELIDGGRAVVARQPVHIEFVESQRVQLSVGGPTYRIRLLDGAGDPCESTSVTLYLDDRSSWSQSTNTDHAGIFEVGPVNAEGLVLCTMPAANFRALGVEVDLPSDPEEVIDVVLESVGRCYMSLHEEGRPAPSVRVEFAHPRTPYYRRFTHSSDEDGSVRGPIVLEGEHTARIASARHWLATHPVAACRESEPTRIEVYSLGRILCEARDAQGRPLAGVRFDLQHETFDESASAWLAGGRVTATAATLTTDASGAIALDRMPRGTYSWTCESPSGEVQTGTAQLAPLGEVTVAARLGGD